MLGDLDLLLDFAGLGERRPRLGLPDLEGDLERVRPLLGGERLGGVLPRGGDLPRYPLGEGPRRLGGDRLQLFLPPPRLYDGGNGRLPRGDGALPPRFRTGDLLTARVIKTNRAVIRLPSICPPSMLIRAFSASSCFSNST